MVASDEGCFSDSSSSLSKPIRMIRYQVPPELRRKVFEKEDSASIDEMLSSVGFLLIVGGAFIFLRQMFKFVNSLEAKRNAKLRAKARAKRNSSANSSNNSASGGNSNSNSG